MSAKDRHYTVHGADRKAVAYNVAPRYFSYQFSRSFVSMEHTSFVQLGQDRLLAVNLVATRCLSFRTDWHTVAIYAELMWGFVAGL